jgi:hypothetical protein
LSFISGSGCNPTKEAVLQRNAEITQTKQIEKNKLTVISVNQTGILKIV